MISQDDPRYSWTRQRMLQEIEALSYSNNKLRKYKKLFIVQRDKYNKLKKKLQLMLISLLD